jgi:AcrR family transcriptional regulator
MKKGAVAKGKRGSAITTRAAILSAAKAQFAAHTYENVGLRDVARGAGIDVALVGRYFGSKRGLFTEVVREIMNPRALIAGDRSTFGQRMAAALLRDGPITEDLEVIFLIIRSAISPAALPILREVSYEQFTEPFATWLGGEHAELRAHLISTAMFGAILARVIDKRLMSSKVARAEYAEEISASLQRYVNGYVPTRPAKSTRRKNTV